MTSPIVKPRQAADPKSILEQIGSSHPVRDGQLELPEAGVQSTAAPESADAAATKELSSAREPLTASESTLSSDVTFASQASQTKGRTDSGPMLRVVRHDGAQEVYDDRLDEQPKPSLQVIEIAKFLRTRSDNLAERETELKHQMHHWQSQLDSQTALSAYRNRALKEREAQIRSLQFELLQLQNDVIDSQLAMEEIIEQFSGEDADAKLILTLEMLRFEVRERFDYVSERWDRLHTRLESLFDNKRRKCA